MVIIGKVQRLLLLLLVVVVEVLVLVLVLAPLKDGEVPKLHPENA